MTSIGMWRIALLLVLVGALPGCSADDATDWPGPAFDGPAVYVSAAMGSESGHGDLSDPVNSVAAAFKLATSGDTIVIATGTYSESVSLPVDVGMKGAGSGETRIEPDHGQSGVTVGKNGGKIRLEGLTVHGATGFGISALVEQLGLVDVEVTGCRKWPGKPGTGHGVQVVGAHALVMESCSIRSNEGVGVVAEQVAWVRIGDPTYTGSPRHDGVATALQDFTPASGVTW